MDPIDRQAAIKEIKAIYEYHDTVTEDRIIDHLKRLPSTQSEVTEEEVKEYCRKRCLSIIDSALLKKYASAQPEITRCGDCKHRMPYEWMFSEIWRSQNISDYSADEIGCEYGDLTMKANDFCSRAERREEDDA